MPINPVLGQPWLPSYIPVISSAQLKNEHDIILLSFSAMAQAANRTTLSGYRCDLDTTSRDKGVSGEIPGHVTCWGAD